MLISPELIQQMKTFVQLTPEKPSNNPCYQSNPRLWNLFRDVKSLPVYIIGIHWPGEDPVCTEIDVVRFFEEYFKFPAAETP